MSRIPVDQPYKITTKFGVADPNSKFGKHTGIDYGVPAGRDIHAPTSGTISYIALEKYNGLVIQLFDGKYYHRMLHNSSTLVKVGAKVKEGQLVARSGNTGLSSGPHCHWDICTAQAPTSFAQFIDPAKWLTPPKPPAPVYPKWVTVNQPILYVRSQPTTKAPLAGSRILIMGMKVRAVAAVKGESVAGNSTWYKSAHGNYFWSGGTK